MFYRINIWKTAASSSNLWTIALLSIFLFTLNATAQSTNVDFPTPVTRGEINGTVAARDVGDARLTTHYYLLAGSQGDLFINVVTNNFNGVIDLFIANSLDAVTKIAVYANLGRTETGRAVYLRKAEKLILRVQGRTPNDSAADYTIKFAGSFVALRDSDAPRLPQLPRVTAGSESGVKVNVVGTILEQPAPPPVEAKEKVEAAEVRPDADAKPAEKPSSKNAEAKTAARSKKPVSEKAETKRTTPANKPAPEKAKAKTAARAEKPTPEKTNTKPAASPKESNRKTAENTRKAGPPVAKTDSPPTESSVATADANPAAARPRTTTANRATESAPAEKPARSGKSAETNTASRAPSRSARPARRTPTPAPPDPMANFRLIVLFKDGKKIERPMTEVVRFGVDKGVLTIVHRDGTTGKYSMITVAKVSVE